MFGDALCLSGVCSLWLVMSCVCLELFTVVGDALCLSGVCSLCLVMSCVYLECVHCGW